MIERLRAERIFVLERGEIEDYYMPHISGKKDKREKVAAAYKFREKATSREAVLKLLFPDGDPPDRCEFDEIFEALFSWSGLPLE